MIDWSVTEPVIRNLDSVVRRRTVDVETYPGAAICFEKCGCQSRSPGITVFVNAFVLN